MQPHRSPPPSEPPDVDDDFQHHAKKLRLMDVSPPSPERRRRPSASLPSIHHLHPNLPPPNTSYQPHQPNQPRPPTRQVEPPPSRSQPQQQFHPAGFISATTTGAPPLPIIDEAPRFAERPSAAGAHQAGQSAASSSSIPEKSLSTAGDSDQDEMVVDQTGPPKKKRRRQALSCTECKRRKIKCDRAHPCGPCQRRGEEDRCQWHVVEPVEKYVTRSEWEEVRGRCRTLEDRCARMERLLSELHASVVGPGAQQRMASPAIPASMDPEEAHPSGLPSSPLLSRPLTATPRAITSNANHAIYHHSADHFSPRSQQGVTSPSLDSGDGDPRSPVRSSSTALGRASASASPTRPGRHVTASEQHHPATPRMIQPPPSSFQPHQSSQHQQHQQRHDQTAHHRQPVSNMSSSFGAHSSSGREAHDVRLQRGALHSPPHLPAMTDRRTSLPFFPPPQAHGVASPQPPSFPLPPPPDADSLSRRQVFSLSPPTLPRERTTLAPTQAQTQGRHVLPPLSPSIRTRSFSQSQAAPPSLVSPGAASTPVPYPRARGPTPSLPSPPKTSGGFAGGVFETSKGTPNIGTSEVGDVVQRSNAFTPPLPPPNEGAYHFPNPPLPRSTPVAQEPFDVSRSHGASTAHLDNHHGRAHSTPYVKEDSPFVMSPVMSPSVESRHRPSSSERPSSNLGHSHSHSHPHLSSRSVHHLHHSKNFLAQTLRAAAEDRLRLDPSLEHHRSSATTDNKPKREPHMGTMSSCSFASSRALDLERNSSPCGVNDVDVDTKEHVPVSSTSRLSRSLSPSVSRTTRPSPLLPAVLLPISAGVASPPVQLLASVY